MERYLRVNSLGPGPRLMKKENLPDRGLTEVEKHWTRQLFGSGQCKQLEGGMEGIVSLDFFPWPQYDVQ